MIRELRALFDFSIILADTAKSALIWIKKMISAGTAVASLIRVESDRPSLKKAVQRYPGRKGV